MPNKRTSPEFDRTRALIGRYSVLDPDDLTVATVWAMGTHCFSPACTLPATFPYLYVSGPAGSGKTVFGQDSMGAVCRNHISATGATGSTLFRMLGMENEETGEIENLAPTLFVDEVDTTFSGSKDPDLQRGLDVGYKRGATIPRSAGKSFVQFPVFGPKLLMGIDNGHLPEPVLQRCIRISMTRQTQDQLTAAGIEPFYIFDVEDEAAEIQQQLSDWAKRHSHILREYRPTPPEGLTARQWEISRTLVQLAHAIGNETEVVAALLRIFARNPQKPDHKVELYGAIQNLFNETGTDRVTSRQIMDALKLAGIRVPGDSMKGLSAVLSEDGVGPQMVRLPNGHPGIPVDPKTGKPQPVQRGYFRHKFDGPFIRFLEDQE